MRTCGEWSVSFDQLYDNISSGQAPGLNEYEKSSFLTRAQEDVVVGVYNGSLGPAFESTEQSIQLLSVLNSQADCSVADSGAHIVPGSVIYRLPDELLFRTFELCYIEVPGCGSVAVQVVPVTQDEFWRTYKNPFKGPNNKRVIRLGSSESNMDPSSTSIGIDKKTSELISAYPITKYEVRYIRRPRPIILEDLQDGLSINGETKARTCELNELLHQTILLGAVQAAKAAWAAQ